MRKYFKGINGKAADGWLLGFTTGCSGIDNEDWIVDTNSLHADEVPPACSDAKIFSQFVAGLLNCFYNRIETAPLSEEQIINFGIVGPREEIPSTLNPTLPFDSTLPF